MDRLSHFIPYFSSNTGHQTRPGTHSKPDQKDDEELLGLQRVMADAQNPRRPVIGIVFFCLLIFWHCLMGL